MGSIVAGVGLGWFVLNNQYLQPRTVLTEEHHWILSHDVEPLGITYLDGNIYIADYRGQAVGVFDPKTGVYGQVLAHSSQGALPYRHPSAIAVGSHNSLYVLNNGSARRALYIMTQSGQVLRHVSLDDTSSVATDLSVASDGTIYVADIVDGAIFKYGPTGGIPRSAWHGQTQSFQNVLSLARDAEGIYAAETSTQRVQQLDRDGRFVRAFDLECQPAYMTFHVSH